PGVALSVDGTVEGWLGSGPALAAEDRLKAELRAARRQDAQSGATSVGPHRSDLEARHLAKDMPAAYCSTGEQKAMLIAIVLAEARLQAAERGVAPLLLLDEVAAHLDEERRKALFDEICGLPGQTWMTGTDAALFAPLGDRAQHFSVADATVADVN
ncbi:MAG: DNA replication and repair protein RecF, partial [Pseudomonadota bacterium]